MSGYGGGYGQGGYGQGGYGQGGGYSAGGYGNNRYEQASQNPYGQAAGNPYGGSGGGYGQSNPYGQSQPQQQQQPYDPPRPVQSTPYGQQSSYTSASYNGQTQSAQQSGYTDVEMSKVRMGPNPDLGRRRLTDQELRAEFTYLDGEINKLESQIANLKSLHPKGLNSVDTNPATNKVLVEIDNTSGEFLSTSRGVTHSLRLLKGQPQAGSEMVAPQIARLDKKLRETINKYQNQDRSYQRDLREQLKRQYRIVRPDATEQEINEVAEDQSQQIFSQALMQSDRRGQAQSALNAVKSRHAAIKKIEEQMNDVANLAIEMNDAIILQETQVQQIDQQATAVEADVRQADVELGGAVVKARAARKKKWICLGIVVAIIIIVVIIVLAWGYGSGTFKSGGNKQ